MNETTGSSEQKKSFYSILGPGVLYAAAAVGVSHLVQATRAGADYGLGLTLVILVACFFKYPALRFGGDYAAATGESLIKNYRTQGWWAFAVYAFAQLFSMVFVIAAIALFTLGLIQAALDFEINTIPGVALLLVLVAAMLLGGHYRFLEKFGKLVVATFSVLIFSAVILVAGKMQFSWSLFVLPAISTEMLIYTVALIGFMPTPTDGSILQSLWICARAEENGELPSPADTRLDFNVGYITSVVLAVCFLLLGTGVMYGRDIELQSSGIGFSRQLIELFTHTIGSWSFPLIAVATVFVMLSTLITVMDGMTRVVVGISQEIIPPKRQKLSNAGFYKISLIALSLLVVLAVATMLKSFTVFLDITSILVFLISPLIAMLNHRAIFSDKVPQELQPAQAMRYWSLAAIVFLLAITLSYFYCRLFTGF